MKEKSIKRFSNIIIITLLIIFVFLGSKIHHDIDVVNHSFVNEERIYNDILEVDDILLDVQNNGKFTDEGMVNFAVQYILKNLDTYSSYISYKNDEFCYIEENTKYFQQGYVNVEVIDKIIFDYFGNKNIDLKSHPYYNKDIQKFALISKRGDGIYFSNVSLVDFSYKDNIIVLTLEYNYLNNKFNVEYYIYINNNHYYIQFIKLCDII